MQVLLSDMGGTNIRFAVMDAHGMSNIVHYRCADFPCFEKVLAHFLSTLKAKPSHFVLAVPAPVLGDELSFVNNPWHFKISDIKEQFNFEKVDVMNDFEAQALAVSDLKKHQILKLGKGTSDKKFPSVIIGAGTGLGVGILLPDGTPLPSEAGNIGLSPANETEEQIFHVALSRYGRVSAERLISGSGLCFLYEFFAQKTTSSEEILKKALRGEKQALQAVFQMFSFLGSVCGDLAMAFCAKGGIYLSGGIIQATGAVDLLKKSDIRNRFEAKGRHQAFVATIPTYAIIQEDIAFAGLKRAGKKYF